MGFLKLVNLKVSVPKPKHKKHNDGITRTSNKIITGKVFIENGIYKIAIDMKNDDTYPDLLVLEFTEKSYELKGRVTVFNRDKVNPVRFIRDVYKCKFFPGLPEQYVPFAPNWIVKGYIVKDNGFTKFDFKDLVGIDGYDNISVSEFDDV